MPDPHATDRSAPASPLPSVAKGGYVCSQCIFTGHKSEVRRHITEEHSPVSPLPQPSTEGEGRDEQGGECCRLGDDCPCWQEGWRDHRRGLEQIGWRNDRGRFCFDHDHHHERDGIEWCEPVYRLGVSR